MTTSTPDIPLGALPAAAVASASAGGATRVLVVDDDAAFLGGVSSALAAQGYAVETAGSARALLERVDAGVAPPDVVLLDILLGDGDGVELLGRLKAHERWGAVPVRMLSSAAAEEYTVRALGLGAADFVRKPVRPRELAARVDAHLRAGRALRTMREALRRTEDELVRARADAESRRKLVDILHEVTGDLAADEIYHLLARRVARALAVAQCAVILDGGAGTGVVATAFELPKLRAASVPLADFPEVGEALATGAPVLIEELGAHPLYQGRLASGLDGGTVAVRSSIALPFAVGRAERGVFLLRRVREQEPLTAADVEFAEAVIGAAVAVVRRAQAIETTRADNVRLEQLATTDPLTGLLNRRALVERLTTEMERALRYDTSVALLLVDLDHFKRVNDTHGHLAGDGVLRAVAELLREEARSSDLVARYGGEEFIVALPETDDAGAVTLAERMRERVAGHVFRAWEGDEALRVTASIGLATFPAARIESVEDLFARADAALYRAKAEGRDRVRA